MNPIYVVQKRSTGEFLRMSRFSPDTEIPVYGPLEAAWLAESAEQAIAQASFLGETDHIAVECSTVTEPNNLLFQVT